MAVLQPFAVKTVLDEEDLTLRADPGEAFIVWDILTYYEDTPYMTVKIDKTTVGYFRNGGPFGGHQNAPDGLARHAHNIRLAGSVGAIATDYWHPIRDAGGTSSKFHVQSSGLADETDLHDIEDGMSLKTEARTKTLLGLLRQKGLWKGFPVAEGETFRIEGVEKDAAKQVVVYSILEPGDVTPEMENGSKSREYLMINYGNCGGDIQATADNLYTTSKNPAEFPDFPFGRVCPGKHEVDLYGILGSAFAPKENENDNHSYTRFLKMVKDREVLFDEDRRGIPFECRALDQGNRIDKFAAGISLIGNFSKHDRNEPLWFDPPLTYLPGDELGIYISLVVKGTGQVIAIDEHEIGLIEKVRRLE